MPRSLPLHADGIEMVLTVAGWEDSYKHQW